MQTYICKCSIANTHSLMFRSLYLSLSHIHILGKHSCTSANVSSIYIFALELYVCHTCMWRDCIHSLSHPPPPPRNMNTFARYLFVLFFYQYIRKMQHRPNKQSSNFFVLEDLRSRSHSERVELYCIFSHKCECIFTLF